MTRSYSVRVTKDYLVFSAGHFITFAGDVCERIHGHNYRVAIEVEDDLDENHYVFDFIALLDMSRAIVAELDHRMLLPDRSPFIQLEDEGPNWRARYKERYWSFPKDECVVLPIPNTTAELVGTTIGERLRQAIVERGMLVPRRMRVEVEENFGQSAAVSWHASSPTVSKSSP
jgi:6-pyruvoyltetrahydropterin/6-carboxytetrahydropterin synthase